MIPQQPQYRHNCSTCLFLGVYKNYDLYACVHEHLTEVIARYSSDGPDYSCDDYKEIVYPEQYTGRHSEAILEAQNRYNKIKNK